MRHGGERAEAHEPSDRARQEKSAKVGAQRASARPTAASAASPIARGLLVSLVNSVWITGAHVLLFDQCVARHPSEAAMMASMPLPTHPRLMTICTGPIIGLVSGLVLGLFAFIASRITRRASTLPARSG